MQHNSFFQSVFFIKSLNIAVAFHKLGIHYLTSVAVIKADSFLAGTGAVSYTHLTLPTKRIV